MVYLLIVGGLAGLVLGGELLVRGAVGVASRMGISPLVIGLTLVGFGTSTPELVTSLQAALTGAPGVAVGNVVGSNVANVLLILGLAALIAPIRGERRTFVRDGGALLAATALGVILLAMGEIGRIAGAVLVAGLAAYLAAVFVIEKRAPSATADQAAAEPAARPMPVPLGLAFFVAGLVLTIFGARFLVGGATELARGLGVSEAVIGLTLVAVGTSLPELVTSVIAALKEQADVALGNVIGSNIYNLLGILGVTALVRPLAVPAQIAAFDVWVMAAATLALLWVVVTGWRVNRWEGAALVAAYAGYLAWLAMGA